MYTSVCTTHKFFGDMNICRNIQPNLLIVERYMSNMSSYSMVPSRLSCYTEDDNASVNLNASYSRERSMTSIYTIPHFSKLLYS